MGLLDPVLDPLLGLGAFWVIVIISLAASLITILVTKFATNQEEMKRLKEQVKEHQNKAKELKGQPEKVLEVQKQAMQANMEYMKHSFRTTLFTMIPFLLILGWMQGNLEYAHITPGDSFKAFVDVEGNFSVNVSPGLQIINKNFNNITIKALKEGNQFIDVLYLGKSYTKEVIVSNEQVYADPVKTFKDEPVKSISIKYNKLKPMGDISILGWRPGWIGVYFMLSILFSILSRKMFKVY